MVKNVARSSSLVDMYIQLVVNARVLTIDVCHILREASANCSFNHNGQYQSLRLMNEQ